MLPLLEEAYIATGKLYFVYKEYPVVNQNLGPIASFAGQCAADQGQFWPMHDWLFANFDRWANDDAVAQVQTGAAELGLDAGAFANCFETQAPRDRIIADIQEGQRYNIRGTPNFVINGRMISGLLPPAQFVAIIDALIAQAESGQLPSTVATVTPTPTPDTDFEPELDLALGDPAAPVVIVEFSDYQCPFCLRHFQQTLPLIKRDYIDTGKVRYIFKDFTPTLYNPSYHPQAVLAALAAECAGAQGDYWPMHNKLFDEQDRWADQTAAAQVLKDFAAELTLDVAAFTACLDSEQFLAEIEADLEEGIAAGVQGTPGTFINGLFVSGAQPYEVFVQVIEAELAKVR
ncbi:MAG: thioredoxin domain-containing protein [Caldilineales bacterium]|nr:thioredoxin domain-containing protein [Caldilineales bacterium]